MSRAGSMRVDRAHITSFQSRASMSSSTTITHLVFMYTKWVIVVDDDIDARDWKDVMWALSTRMDPARDITLIENTPIDYLDFASPESGLGSKIGLDATNKWPPETRREWGRQIAMDPAAVGAVTGECRR